MKSNEASSISSAKDESHQKILIIEDDRCLQTILCNSIKSISPSIEVQWATDGEEALQKMKDQEFKLVIADFTLPGVINGLWIWEKCQRMMPRTSFILMSGLPIQQFLEITSGQKVCPTYLSKPFRKKEFFDLVSSALKKAS